MKVFLVDESSKAEQLGRISHRWKGKEHEHLPLGGLIAMPER